MTAEKEEKSTEPSGAEKSDPTGEFPRCGSGCGCKEPTGKDNKKIKIAICLAVVVAIGGIPLFKTISAKQIASGTGTPSFSAALAANAKGVALNSASQKGGSGASLSAIAELNTVAEKMDTVFLIIPDKDNAPSTKETRAVLASLEQTLNAKGLSTGVYTLKATSPDYPDVAAKVAAPGIAVLSKGGGIGYVTGGISEPKLIQAYVASTRSGGCCPPPTDGKAAVPCK